MKRTGIEESGQGGQGSKGHSALPGWKGQQCSGQNTAGGRQVVCRVVSKVRAFGPLLMAGPPWKEEDPAPWGAE